MMEVAPRALASALKMSPPIPLKPSAPSPNPASKNQMVPGFIMTNDLDYWP